MRTSGTHQFDVTMDTENCYKPSTECSDVSSGKSFLQEESDTLTDIKCNYVLRLYDRGVYQFRKRGRPSRENLLASFEELMEPVVQLWRVDGTGLRPVGGAVLMEPLTPVFSEVREESRQRNLSWSDGAPSISLDMSVYDFEEQSDHSDHFRQSGRNGMQHIVEPDRKYIRSPHVSACGFKRSIKGAVSGGVHANLQDTMGAPAIFKDAIDDETWLNNTHLASPARADLHAPPLSDSCSTPMSDVDHGDPPTLHKQSRIQEPVRPATAAQLTDSVIEEKKVKKKSFSMLRRKARGPKKIIRHKFCLSKSSSTDSEASMNVSPRDFPCDSTVSDSPEPLIQPRSSRDTGNIFDILSGSQSVCHSRKDTSGNMIAERTLGVRTIKSEKRVPPTNELVESLVTAPVLTKDEVIGGGCKSPSDTFPDQHLDVSRRVTYKEEDRDYNHVTDVPCDVKVKMESDEPPKLECNYNEDETLESQFSPNSHIWSGCDENFPIDTFSEEDHYFSEPDTELPLNETTESPIASFDHTKTYGNKRGHISSPSSTPSLDDKRTDTWLSDTTVDYAAHQDKLSPPRTVFRDTEMVDISVQSKPKRQPKKSTKARPKTRRNRKPGASKVTKNRNPVTGSPGKKQRQKANAVEKKTGMSKTNTKRQKVSKVKSTSRGSGLQNDGFRQLKKADNGSRLQWAIQQTETDSRDGTIKMKLAPKTKINRKRKSKGM